VSFASRENERSTTYSYYQFPMRRRRPRRGIRHSSEDRRIFRKSQESQVADNAIGEGTRLSCVPLVKSSRKQGRIPHKPVQTGRPSYIEDVRHENVVGKVLPDRWIMNDRLDI
jgi:hypothetical protein